METLVAIVIGALGAASIYCLLRRSVAKFIVGIALMSQAVNLLIFMSAGMTRGEAPLIEGDATTLASGYADPLPQALILTAIVIGFGLLAFTLALSQRAIQSVGSDDLEDFDNTDK